MLKIPLFAFSIDLTFLYVYHTIMSNPIIRSFYFFRHGETNWNKNKICQGHMDIPLNEAGRSQARELQILLKQFDLKYIYSSDLSRAFETAEIVAQGKIPVKKLKILREAYLGEGEGQSYELLIEKYGSGVEQFFKGLTPEIKNSSILPGAETPGEVIQRLYDSLDLIMQECSASRIGISTHGGALRNFIQEVSDPLTHPIIIPNCVVYRVTYHTLSKVWDVDGPLC